jgi:hypothetical protein
MNILLLVVEITVLIVIVFLFNWIFGMIIQQMTKMGLLKEDDHKILTLRRNIRILLLLICAILSLCILVTGGVLIYQGKSVQKFQLDLILAFAPTPKLWIEFFADSLKSIMLLMLVKYTIPVTHRFLDIASERAQNFDDITNNNESIKLFFNSIKTILANSLWILAITFCTQFFNLLTVITNTLYLGFKCYLVLSIGLLIDLRTTRIRHPNGQVYIIRNGEIKDVINYSKNYIYAVVEVGVSYQSNLTHVYEVLETLGKELKEKNSDVLEKTKVDGVQKFEDSALIIRTITKVKSGKHLPIERVLRKMIKDAFDREDIQFSDDLESMALQKKESKIKSITN